MYLEMNQKQTSDWCEVRLKEDNGGTRKLYITTNFLLAFKCMNDWRRKYLNSNQLHIFKTN